MGQEAPAFFIYLSQRAWDWQHYFMQGEKSGHALYVVSRALLPIFDRVQTHTIKLDIRLFLFCFNPSSW